MVMGLVVAQFAGVVLVAAARPVEPHDLGFHVVGAARKADGAVQDFDDAPRAVVRPSSRRGDDDALVSHFGSVSALSFSMAPMPAAIAATPRPNCVKSKGCDL